MIEEYAYDSNHVLVRKMVKFLSDDAGGFSEFRTTYSPARKEIPPLGLPERTEETYKDHVTNEVKLLQMAVFEYSPVGYLLKKEVYDANRALAYTLSWEYDLHGNVIKEVNAMGETILKTYDANDNLILQQHFPSGEEIEYTYDFSNRLIRQKTTYNGQSSTLSYQYNYLSQRVVTTNSYGQETHHTYDDLGRLVAIHHPAVVNENGEVVQPKETKTYDIAGNPISLVDAIGQKTKIEYNIRGKPTKTTYPDGTVETCLYRMDGQLISKKDRNGVVTNYKRDPLGRITEESVCSSEGIVLKTTHYIYNALHLLRMIDPDGLETTYQYDGAGRLEKTIQGDRVQQHFYDALGRLHEVREWVGTQEHEFRSTIKEYDLLDRVIEERLQAGDGTVLHLQRYAYDHRGNRTLEQIGDQRTVTEYNVYNQPMTITNNLGQVTHISYNTEFINAYGQCVLQTTTTDPSGYQTVHTYDTAQRLVETARYNPFGVRVAYQQKFYNVCGNCCRILDHVIEAGEEKRTIETQLLYTAYNELEKLVEAFNTPEQKITQFHYNHLGQKEAIIKPDGVTLIHSYDALGRLKSLKSSDDSIDYVYEYNHRDQVLNVTDKVHDQITFRHYDTRGQLDREILGHGLIVEYTYDRVGRVNKIRLPDKSEVEYVYDAVDLKEVHRVIKNKRCYSHVAQTYNLAGQVTQVQLPGKGGRIHYAYDDLGRSVKVKAQAFQQHIPAEGFDEAGNLRLFYAQDVAYHFDYDDLYQLKAEQGHIKHAYQFDSLFNRTLRDKEAHTYNALNQVCRKGKEQFIYDKNGNLKQRKLGKEVTLYDYDALDRLISVKKGKHTVTYVYDPFNRRLSKDQTGQESQLFVYQGQEEVGCWCQGAFQELRLLGEKSRSSMVALEIKETLYVPVHDLVGNVVCLLDAQGDVVERYRYTAFGESEILSPEGKRLETSVVGNPWRYASKRFDEETGFVAFGLRYYDPRLGRWVTADPAGFEDGPNLYAYVHNSPLLYYDQYGLFAVAGLSYSTFEFGQKSYSNDFLPRAGSIDNYANSWSWHTHELPPLFFTEDSARYSLNDMINPETGRNFELREDLDHRISFSGGIATNLARHVECLQHVSKLSDGYNVRGVHHATRGIWRDIYCYLRSYLGDIPYQAAKLQVQDWIQSIQNSSPNAALLHYTFSRGVADTRLALQFCPKEIRDRIDVRVFGAADFISPDLCRSIFHYICKGDPVSEFAIKTSRKEFEKYRDTIIFIDPLPGQGRLDSHSFTNPVYEPYIKMNSTKYLRS